MAVRTYRLTTNTVAGIVGQVPTQVVAAGTIVGIAYFGTMTVPAGMTWVAELAINNQTQSQAVAPTLVQAEQVVARFGMIASTAFPTTQVNGYCPCSRRVVAGNILCINSSVVNGPATSVLLGFDVMIDEG